MIDVALSPPYLPKFEGEGKNKHCVNCDYYFYEVFFNNYLISVLEGGIVTKYSYRNKCSIAMHLAIQIFIKTYFVQKISKI